MRSAETPQSPALMPPTEKYNCTSRPDNGEQEAVFTLPTQSLYRFQGARSRQCCRLEWFSRSGPRAGSGARCADQKRTCCSEFPTPPSRCHNSCAEKHPAGPARGWRWRRSRADGGAGYGERTNERLWYKGRFSSPLTFLWRDSALQALSETISNSYNPGLHHLQPVSKVFLTL